MKDHNVQRSQQGSQTTQFPKDPNKIPTRIPILPRVPVLTGQYLFGLLGQTQRQFDIGLPPPNFSVKSTYQDSRYHGLAFIKKMFYQILFSFRFHHFADTEVYTFRALGYIIHVCQLLLSKCVDSIWSNLASIQPRCQKLDPYK